MNIKNGVPMFDLTLPTPKKRNPKIFTSSKASKDELSRVLPDFEPVLFKYGGIKINTRGNMFDDKSSRKGFLSLSLKYADCLAPIIGFCITRILPLIQIHEEMLVSKVIEENILDMSVGKTSNSTDGKTTLSEIIAGGESTHVEFKPAIWYNHTRALNDPNYSPGKDTNVSDNIVRTVAGFLNAEGGSLFIGVSDAGDAYGIENDIALTRRKDHDGLENELTQLLSNAVSVEIVATKVTVSLPTFQKKVIARVDVKRANSPVYMKTERHKDKFYVRVNNATEPFSLETAMNYIAMHDWKREDE